ncbi:MAG TPA: tRNA lysidine(34) synthetase TilS [Syntrophomonadaceae bacterium]|nr:tRNA lysidine(34) synthetase TilS [Syntrophomonadaceae bacterium]
MPTFKEKVEDLIKKKKLIDSGMRVVVGVSGGADSIALLSILKELAPSLSLDLYAAHLNHLLREEAWEDAAFVQEFARSMEVPVTVGYARVAHLARTHKMSIEEAGRWARYCFLRHVASRVGAQRIAVGHHLGDQVETVIFNFLRGAGAAGLAGIPVRNRGVVRPLLGVTREEIEDYCRSHGFTWCTDVTNLATDYQRNRIRVELLPYLRQYFNPQVDRAVTQTADIISQENAFLNDMVGFLLWELAEEGAQGEFKVSLDKFLSFPLAIQRRLLRKVIRREGGGLKDIGYQNYEDCLSFLKESRPGGELHLPQGLRLIKGSGYFTVLRSRPKYGAREEVHHILEIPGETKIPELGVSISAEIRPHKDFPDQFFYFLSENYQVCFDYDKIKLPLFVRTRRAGDRIRTFGLEGTKKLKKLFNDLKVPSHQRDSVPLVASNGKIHWVVGHRRGATASVTRETKQVLLLQVHYTKQKQDIKRQ